MASLSLPRVLQQRKTSLEIERENFEKCQQTAISKAINNLESPVKQKHVRSTIIGTFQEKGAQTFWIVTLRLPLQEDRIVAWKFCHVLHKLLREGYPTTIVHSQRHKGELENLGKLWVHLRDCYGKLIKLYCALLIAKLDFHRRNPKFPGNLALTHSELENIGENDINNYFEMAVEMFDYMDSILDLQAAIFGSIDRSRSNSMTSSGQCRLSPLIPCIQDASRLYDFCVKILFKLHNALPADTLSGHRERFLKQFKELKLFYQNANMLQYFRTLISVPSLPDNPPNFLIQAELRTYVTPVVIIPPEDPETDLMVQEGSLIDTSETADVGDSASQNGTTSPFLIDHLQRENKGLREEIQRVSKESQTAIAKLQEQIMAIETELATKDSELFQERQLKEDLLQQTAAVAASVQNQDSEKKLKDEKIEKWKNLYIKLRELHIQLIRQKAGSDKKLVVATNKMEELEKSKNDFDNLLQNTLTEKENEIANMKLISDKITVDLNNLQKEHHVLVTENEALNSKIEKLMHDKSNLEYQLSDMLQQKRQLEEQVSSLEATNRSNDEALNQLRRETSNEIQSLTSSILHQSEIIMQHSIDEVDNPALSGLTCSPDYFSLQTEPCLKALAKISSAKECKNVCMGAIRLANVMGGYVIKGRAASNASPDIMFGEQMAVKCKQLGASIILILQSLQSNTDIQETVDKAITEVKAMSELAETLQGTLKENSSELLADLVENELSSMDKAIEEASIMIQEMLRKSREADSGIKLEVNEKILDSCTKLMQAIRVLVQKSRLLQAEIVAQGKGSASVKEFYKRNHRWTDGLISAAKAVGTAAGFLLNSADIIVQGNGKLEQLAVAAQEIAASTAQLVVASRVKASRGSDNLQQVSIASKKVTNATGEVVATVKDCASMIDEQEEFDASKLTLHSAKRQEMDTQIRVLELEKELEQNRVKLAALRKQHYQLAGESEGWEVV